MAFLDFFNMYLIFVSLSGQIWSYLVALEESNCMAHRNSGHSPPRVPTYARFVLARLGFEIAPMFRNRIFQSVLVATCLISHIIPRASLHKKIALLRGPKPVWDFFMQAGIGQHRNKTILFWATLFWNIGAIAKNGLLSKALALLWTLRLYSSRG